MLIDKNSIEEFNQPLLKDHQRKFEFVAAEFNIIEPVMKKLMAFQVAIPSWALGSGGTRFGRFAGTGEPRSLDEKMEDVGLLHALNQSSGAISLHIPWDIPENYPAIKAHAAQLGLKFDAVNSNTFQDQKDQKRSYKFGSLQHVDKAVRDQAIAHNIEVIRHGEALGSEALTVWLSDGSCFPGQLNFRKAFQNTLESLEEIYAALPANWKLFIEYKAFEPNFYSMTVGDWGQSLIYANKLGPKAYTLVDLGHHLANANIEQIVALLLMEGKLGGFHFNDSKYGDDDLTVGSIKPYQLFLIFNELVEGMDARGMDHGSDLGWMIDASHNVKDPLEDLLQSIEAIMLAYAQALLVDRNKLNEAQQANDVVSAQEVLQGIFRTDVRAIVAEARLRSGGALDPFAIFPEGKNKSPIDQGKRQPHHRNGIVVKRTPVILIFDIGKTNKKVLLFDEQYKPVYEESTRFDEISDEDGLPCEDVLALTEWVKERFQHLAGDKKFEIRGVNFSAYGASFVYLDEQLNVIPPLSNYLKPFPPEIQQKFYDDYGGESSMAKQTASPVLGNLNSGLQLYRLKYSKPDLFVKIRHALHLPQYLSFILTGALHSDITSVGCHTHLWDFPQHCYHHWVQQEGLLEKLPPFLPCDAIAGYAHHAIPAGAGLHDSSAALIPYVSSFKEPFILISTGTWCISLNPFNSSPLTDAELKEDCLCYLSHDGKPVKAARLFAGHEHEKQVERLATHFGKPGEYYTSIAGDIKMLKILKAGHLSKDINQPMKGSAFHHRDLNAFKTYEAAYHQLMTDIMQQQVRSTNLVLSEAPVKRIFVDGGFSKNPIYMHLLAAAFPQMEVYASSVPQASAIGAALVIDKHWNTKPLPKDLIALQLYSVSNNVKK